jgi:hypothetical protein
MDDGDYINMNMVGHQAKLLELPTRNELRNAPVGDTGLITNLDGLKDELETVEEEVKL